MAAASRAHNERVGGRLTGSRSYPNYLGDVVYAAEKAREFTAGMAFSDFTDDDKTVFAVIRMVEIMGEATSRTRADVLLRYPRFPGAALWICVIGLSTTMTTLTCTSFGMLLLATFLSCLLPLEQTRRNESRLPTSFPTLSRPFAPAL